MKKPSFYTLIIGAACALVIGTGTIGWLIYRTYFDAFKTLPGMRDEDRANWGVMGDYFGGTFGPILNGVTVCMLVIGFLFQHRQLMDAKRDALNAHLQAQAEQKLLMKQSFEQTFFSWLQSYREIVNEIKIGTRHGKDAISMLLSMRFSTDQFSSDGAVAKIAQASEINAQYNRLLNFDAPFEECNLIGPSALAAYDFAYASAVGELDIMGTSKNLPSSGMMLANHS